jgi:hypothetical protein
MKPTNPVVKPTSAKERKANVVKMLTYEKKVKHRGTSVERSKYFFRIMLSVEQLLLAGPGNIFKETLSLTLFVRFRNERKAVYTVLDYYQFDYSSAETRAISGQDGPRHCEECGPDYIIPAKRITFFGPSKMPLEENKIPIPTIREIWNELAPPGAKQRPPQKKLPNRLYPKCLQEAPESASLLPCFPADILVLILAQLERPIDVYNASLTCKAFANAIRRDEFWHFQLTGAGGRALKSFMQKKSNRKEKWIQTAKRWYSNGTYHRFCRAEEHSFLMWPHHHKIPIE